MTHLIPPEALSQSQARNSNDDSADDGDDECQVRPESQAATAAVRAALVSCVPLRIVCCDPMSIPNRINDWYRKDEGVRKAPQSAYYQREIVGQDCQADTLGPGDTQSMGSCLVANRSLTQAVTCLLRTWYAAEACQLPNAA